MFRTRLLFFELLKVALGNRKSLSRVPSDEEWTDLYNESERQAVTGILFHGIERLPAEQRPSRLFLLQWIGVAQLIEQQNHVMDERCLEVLQILSDNGLNGSVLKGQGIAKLYDVGWKKEDGRGDLSALRQSGDIDVYVDCGFRKALSTVQKLKGLTVKSWDYKHLHLNIWKDTTIEVHYRVEVLLNLWKNRKLQKWFKEHETLIYSKNNGFTTPTTIFNVFYILLHIYRHFLYEGVGFKQIVDYYFVVKNLDDNHNDNSVVVALDAVQEFGMEKFAKGLMWVMQEALGMPREWMLWEPDKKEGEYILSQVMQGGNFGHYDERLKHGGGKWNTVIQVCKHNWHLLRHYPTDVIWAPVWFVWHKCWKIFHKRSIAIEWLI